jgi:hypothetical protein
MRLLGLVLILAGAAGVVFGVRQTLESQRPRDVAFAVLSWVSVVVALLGLALTFVPGFLT